MANFGGNNFGQKTTTAAATTATGLGGFSTPAASTTGTPQFNFGNPTAAAKITATPGFGFGTPAAAAAKTTATPGFGFGTPAAAAAKTTATPGFGFGTPAAAAPTSGLTLGTPAAATSTAVSGFSLGGTPLAQASGGLGSTTTAATGGLSLTGTTAQPTGLFPGVSTTTSSAAPSFNFAKPAAGGLSLFGQTTASTSSTVGTSSIFGQSQTKPASVGLGGVDPKTTSSASGTASNGSKAIEGKTVKETPVEPTILTDVDTLQKFVKEQKSEMEHIKRMSSTPMIKVQEDCTALRQLLSVVSSGVQRNACAVEKLKKEMTQELKNVEMSLRTKEIPPGLQYENMAPTKYFQELVEHFEGQMLAYRQQIETLESHLSSLHQPSRLTPDELIKSLRNLNLAFVAVAAQLQQVHEAVKTQKEHYLNYRKVFLGDSRDIFERQKKAPVRIVLPTSSNPYGQSPFPGINDATAVAMATALNRSQQPQPQAGAPPVTGFTQFPQTSSTFGFGAPKSTGLLGNASNLATTQQSGSLFGTFGTPNTALAPASAEQPFPLGRPPLGSKRNKR